MKWIGESLQPMNEWSRKAREDWAAEMNSRDRYKLGLSEDWIPFNN